MGGQPEGDKRSNKTDLLTALSGNTRDSAEKIRPGNVAAAERLHPGATGTITIWYMEV